MNKIAVTGATGFIGRRLVKNLALKSCELRLFSRNNQEGFETIICDLESDFAIGDAFTDVNTVFHLAGFAHDLRNTSKIEHLYRVVNVDATVRLLELAADHRVERFIFVSSVKAGGHSISGKSMTEEDCAGPEGVYGQTKREAELKVLEMGRQSGMHVSIVRPSLVYGPGVKGNLALMRRCILKGWFPPLPETGNRRSMIHVDDLVRALLMVAEDKRANGEIFIATDGVPYSSREIYETICRAVGKKAPAWSVPKFFFDWLSLLNPRLRYKVDKLLGDECYSSEKLERLGFRAMKSLRDFDESDYSAGNSNLSFKKEKARK